MNRNKDTLALVTGANGAVGATYLEALAKQGIQSIGMTRREVTRKVNGVVYNEGVDLLDKRAVDSAILEMDLRGVKRLVLIHPVGEFKFEQEVPQTPDLSVRLSNAGTFQFLAHSLIQHAAPEELVMCGFGSVSDRYRVPYWHSYTAAKDELRFTLRGIVELLNPMQRKALALMVNVSTTDTGNENRLRPKADRSFWLPPQTIVDRSLPILLDAPIEPPHYREMDVFQEQPGFDPAAYYGNADAVLEKWGKEMGKGVKAD